MKRALAILDRLNPDESALTRVLNGMISLYEAQGRQVEAEALADRLLALRNPGVRRLGYGPVVIPQHTGLASSPIRVR